MTPSATAAESKLSIAPKMAIVIAGDTRFLIVSHESAGTVASGSELLIANRSPIVSMLSTPANCLRSNAATVITMIATSEPGIFLLTFGVSIMITTLTIPITELQRSTVEKLLK